MRPAPRRPTLFPYTTLFRSAGGDEVQQQNQNRIFRRLCRMNDVATSGAAGRGRGRRGIGATWSRIAHECLSLAFIGEIDRKSTRLNSSHGYISYAVFCLKKK